MITIDNDVSSPTVGRVVNLDPCGLWRHSPAGERSVAIPTTFVDAIVDLPDDVIDGQIAMCYVLLEIYQTEMMRRHNDRSSA